MAGRVTLITGASAGIGYELSRIFARAGHRVALVARRAERLQALADEIVAAGGEQPLVIICDLAKPDACSIICTALDAEGVEVEYLVNNAGFGLFGEVVALDRDEQLAMTDVNVRVLTELCLCFADQLIRARGGILNVASLAGFLPGPRMAVYYATKAFVLSFSEALHSELESRGVRVTVLCPGPVPTEFAERAGIKGGSLAPDFLSQTADDVAEAGYRGLMDGHRTIVPGLLNRLIVMTIRFVPRRFLLAVLDRRQRRRRSAPQA